MELLTKVGAIADVDKAKVRPEGRRLVCLGFFRVYTTLSGGVGSSRAARRVGIVALPGPPPRLGCREGGRRHGTGGSRRLPVRLSACAHTPPPPSSSLTPAPPPPHLPPFPLLSSPPQDSKNLRRGKGKMRNRRYVQRKGPLVIYGNDSGIR